MQSFDNIRFEKFSRFIYNEYGIFLSEIKKEMVHTKIDKLMSRYNINSYDEYYNILASGMDRQFLTDFANEITINKTDFFREINHFDFIQNNIGFIIGKNERILRNNEIRVWSSACSTGQEPYTLAMVLKECLPEGMGIKILGTDVNSKVLADAKRGLYPMSIKNEVRQYYLQKYFKNTGREFMIEEDLKKIVTFRQFNLMEPFPFKNTFDMIFCRNVMIYFDSEVQQRLLDKFYSVIAPGGLLFIGHSESLTNKKHKFEYVQPTVYIK